MKDPKINGASAREMLDKLSNEAKSVVKTKRFSGRIKFGQLRDLLSELSRFDEITDALYKSAVNRSILTGVVLVLLIIGSALGVVFKWELKNSIGDPMAAAVIAAAFSLSVLAAALLVFFIVKTVKLGRVDLGNDFRLCLAPLLDDLGEDVDPKSTVRAELSLGGLDSTKLVDKKSMPPGRFKKVTQYVYRDDWCDLQFKFTDGGMARLAITNNFVKHDRRWTKRSASGKTKFKHKDKWKKLVLVTTSLAPAGSGLEWDEQKVESGAGGHKIKRGERKGNKSLELVGKFKYKAVNETPAEAPSREEVMGMFMRLYSMAAPSKEKETVNV